MPCNTISLIPVVLGKVDKDLFIKALEELGHSPKQYGNLIQWGRESYNLETLELRVTSQISVDEIKVAYAAENLKQQMTEFGWSLEQTGEGEFIATKASYG